MGNKFPQTYLSYREEPSNHQHCQHTMFFHVLVLQQLSSLLLSPGPVPSKRIKKKKGLWIFLWPYNTVSSFIHYLLHNTFKEEYKGETNSLEILSKSILTWSLLNVSGNFWAASNCDMPSGILSNSWVRSAILGSMDSKKAFSTERKASLKTSFTSSSVVFPVNCSKLNSAGILCN